MPHPWKALRWIAATYVFIGGCGLSMTFIYEGFRDGGIVVGGGARHVFGEGEAITFSLWLAAVVITGWYGMARESD